MTDGQQVFDLGPRFFGDLRRAIWLRGFPVVLAALGAALLTAGRDLEPALRIVLAGVLAAIGLYATWQASRRQEESFRGFRLVVGADAVRRIQPGLPDLEIGRGEVVRLVEVPGKGLTVFGTGRQSFITVPRTLNGFEEARARLVAWREPEVRASTLAHWLPALAGLLGVAALVAVMTSGDRTVVTACGAAMIAALLASMAVIRRSPHLDRRTRRMIWFLPVVLLMVAWRIWAVWQP